MVNTFEALYRLISFLRGFSVVRSKNFIDCRAIFSMGILISVSYGRPFGIWPAYATERQVLNLCILSLECGTSNGTTLTAQGSLTHWGHLNGRQNATRLLADHHEWLRVHGMLLIYLMSSSNGQTKPAIIGAGGIVHALCIIRLRGHFAKSVKVPISKWKMKNKEKMCFSKRRTKLTISMRQNSVASQ